MNDFTGEELLEIILNETGADLNALLMMSISARLNQLISVGLTSDLGFSVVLMGMSPKIRESVNESVTTLKGIVTDAKEYLSSDDPAPTDEPTELPTDEPTDTPTDEPTNPNTYSNINDGLSNLSTMSSQGVSSLASGDYWSDSLSTITFSFNDSIPDSYYNYGYELTQGSTPLNTAQRDTIRDITTEINKLLGITLQEVSSEGLIRFSVVDMNSAGTAGFSFYPDESPDYGGDMFLSSLFNDPNTNYDYRLEQSGGGWTTMVHEFGHSLGLKHPFEDGVTLPSNLDNTAHSIMSYTELNNYEPLFTLNADNSIQMEYQGVGPQLYPIYDLSALQAIYGVNTTTDAGNNTYSFSYSDTIYETIWDTGGVDSFNLSTNLGDTTLDLNSGSLNSIDQYSLSEVVSYHQALVNYSYHNSWIQGIIEDLYQSNELYTGENNIAIAEGVIIENVTTGSGNDTITDNEVDNIINTAFGDDSIFVGHGGYDIVDGGTGTDTLFIDFLQSDLNIEIYQGDYLLYSDTYAVQFQNIEYITFQDNSTLTPETFIA